MINKDLRKKIQEILKTGNDIANVVRKNGENVKIRQTDNYELFIGESPEKITASFKDNQLMDMHAFYRDEQGKCYTLIITRYKPYDKK